MIDHNGIGPQWPCNQGLVLGERAVKTGPAAAIEGLMKRNFELLGEIRRHLVRIFDCEEVPAEVVVHKLPR